jgi:glycosyltransferase involved in cell wall biosynthesis
VNNRKNVLVVLSRGLFPLDSGGKYASYNFILLLRRYYQVDIFIVDDNKDFEEIEYSKICSQVHRSRQNLLFRLTSAFFLFLWKKMPLQLGLYYSKNLKVFLRETKYDIIFPITPRVAFQCKNLKTPIIHYSIDSFYLSYKNSEAGTVSFFWKWIYKIESHRFFNIEKDLVASFEATVFVNPQDSKFWSRYGKSICLPQIINSDKRNGVEFKVNHILFIGKMDYRPNIEALFYFVNKIFPFVSQEIELHIYGAGMSERNLAKLRALAGKRFKYFGFKEDINEIISSYKLSIAPMLTGGGIQTKVVQSMYCRTLTLVSPLVSKGMVGVEHLKESIIYNDNLDAIKYINDVFEDYQKYFHIIERAYSYVDKTYSKEAVISKFESSILI